MKNLLLALSITACVSTSLAKETTVDSIRQLSPHIQQPSRGPASANVQKILKSKSLEPAKNKALDSTLDHPTETLYYVSGTESTVNVGPSEGLHSMMGSTGCSLNSTITKCQNAARVPASQPKPAETNSNPAQYGK